MLGLTIVSPLAITDLTLTLTLGEDCLDAGQQTSFKKRIDLISIHEICVLNAKATVHPLYSSELLVVHWQAIK